MSLWKMIGIQCKEHAKYVSTLSKQYTRVLLLSLVVQIATTRL